MSLTGGMNYFGLQIANCKYDRVEIYDGAQVEPNGPFCGTNSPPEITSFGNRLWVKFQTDETNTYKGFAASFSSIVGETDMIGAQAGKKFCLLIRIFNFVVDFELGLCIWSHEEKLKNVILVIFFSPCLISGTATISRDTCGLAELVTDHRMKIDLPYNNNLHCFISLKLHQTKTFKLTIDNFRVRLVNYLLSMNHLIISLSFRLKDIMIT